MNGTDYTYGIVDPAVERYAVEHTSAPDPALSALASETAAALASPEMLTGPVEGRLLALLVFATRAQLVLELGTYSGYSALSMAAALGPDGRLITCELSPEHADFARRHIEASPYADRIDLRSGPALQTLRSLEGPFDLVFIDADKPSYRDYYEAALPKLAPHGLIVVDNTLWSGRVLRASDTDADESTRALAAFNDHVVADPRVVCVMLTVRDGITLIRHAA
jgi:caffeoyl-CoA O-methyltransferase